MIRWVLVFFIIFLTDISLANVSQLAEEQPLDVDVDIQARISSISSIWTGRTIQIGEETFYFRDQSQFEHFSQQYGSTNCLATQTTAETCECQQILLQARLDAIEHGVQLSETIETPLAQGVSNSQHQRTKRHIKNFREYQEKLELFTAYTTRLVTKKINGEQCQDFGHYKNQRCQNMRGNFRNRSCACYEKWLRQNISYITRKINSELSKIRNLNLQGVSVTELLKTSVGLLDNCQREIINPIAFTRQCSRGAPDLRQRPSRRRRARRQRQTRSRSIQLSELPSTSQEASEEDEKINNDALKIKNLSMREILCGAEAQDSLTKRQIFFNFMKDNYEHSAFSGSSLKQEVDQLGDLKWCLLSTRHMRSRLPSRITSFSSKFGSAERYQYACRFSGLTMGSFCAPTSTLDAQFRRRMANNCSSAASGYVQIPPYGVGFPSIYQNGAISGIEIKNTSACEFLMEKCEELSRQVTFTTQNKSELHTQLQARFLRPFSDLRYNGRPAAEACHGSAPTRITRVIERVTEAALNVDVNSAVSSVAAEAIGIALKSNPAMSRVYENGGRTFFEFLLRSIIRARYKLSTVQVSPTNRNGTPRTPAQIERIRQEILHGTRGRPGRIDRLKAAIVNDAVSTACGSAKSAIEPQPYVKYIVSNMAGVDMDYDVCKDIIERSSIVQKITELITPESQ